jgi:predicted helicase
MGLREAKSANIEAQAIFQRYSLGAKTARDDWMFDFDRNVLASKVRRLAETYNGEVDRWQRRTRTNEDVDDFVIYDNQKIKWSRDLKLDLQRGRRVVYSDSNIRRSQYRPYCKQYIYLDRILNEEVYQVPIFFPTNLEGDPTRVICVSGLGHDVFVCLISHEIPEYKYANGANGGTQCFPFYTYNEDGAGRRENITDWALARFQAQYGEAVTKRDIFHYVYAVLHHPQYRERYAENLKRELPRIPFVAHEAFPAFVKSGATLAELHVTYERAPEFPLRWIENKDIPFSWRVKKMKLTPAKDAVIVNESLTLAGIPQECFEYRLGNRSALEWVIDQYQVSTDKRSGITSDPNRTDDEEYIVRLIGRVVTVSVETVKLVRGLPALLAVESSTA